MSIQFHQTQMGHRFFNHQLPKLIKGIELLQKTQEENNDLLKKLLDQKLQNNPLQHLENTIGQDFTVSAQPIENQGETQ